MRRIVAIARPPTRADDSVRLDLDLRTRRRMVFTTVAGAAILLDRARPAHLRDGDGLVLDDGTIVRVDAVPEPLIEIAAPGTAALVRIAWHLGNRHLPTQLLGGDGYGDGDGDGAGGGRLRIRADHVIAAMVAGLGGSCTAIDAPFDPEGGAYPAEGEPTLLHAHDHGDDHAHDHGRAHDHDAHGDAAHQHRHG